MRIISNKLDEEIKEIANILSTYNCEDLDISLFDGATGTSLALFYYSRYSNNNKFITNGVELLQKVINSLENSFVEPSLVSGLAGIGWTIEHLKKEGFLDFESEDLLFEIDNILLSSMDNLTKDFPILDYLYGLQGICYYFLMRGKGHQFIENTLKVLEKNAIREDDGSIKWIYYPISEKIGGEPCFNLGLSHGIASTIHFLLTLVKENIFSSRAKKLLIGAIKYLLSQRLDQKLFFSSFPKRVPIKSENFKPSNSRLAWCYGDIGIGYTLLTASDVLDDNSLRDEALAILLKTTTRKSIETGISDIGFCHGASGLAHIFNKLYSKTKIKKFRDSANFWLTQTLIYLSEKRGVAIQKNVNKFGIFCGWGGVLLTLMAFSDKNLKTNHNWDKMFML